MIYKNILELVGNTPLLQIEDRVFAKMENRNPSFSVKDRACLEILSKIKDQILEKGQTIVESTSGNFGIALAMMCAVYQIPLTLVMPSSMSNERKQLIKAYGANLILTEPSLGMQGAKDRVNQLLADDKYVSVQQFKNPNNPYAHYKATAEEIYHDLPNIDIFVAGVGTGGTISGVGKRLKELNPNIKIVAVEPKESPIITEGKAGPHKIQGIGANFIPENFNRQVVDEVMTISQDDAIKQARQLVRQGISAGISSGANIFAAKQLAMKYPNQKVVTIICDNVERYLSTNLFDEE